MERRLWRGVDADLFRFTTTELQDLHLAVMFAFEQAAVLAPALGLDQIRTALRGVGWDDPIPDEVLQRALASLTGWQLLEVTQDHAARYATPEEFERKNLQWSLTQRGEAAVSGVLHALNSLHHAVGLQAAVLDAIGDGLSDIAELLTTAAHNGLQRPHPHHPRPGGAAPVGPGHERPPVQRSSPAAAPGGRHRRRPLR